MPVPSHRLLTWTALLVIPVLGFAVMMEAWWLMGVLVAFAGIVVVDFVLARSRLRGIEGVAGEPVRLSVDHRSDFPLRFTKPMEVCPVVRVGLALPEWMHSEKNPLETRLPSGAEQWRIDWEILPLRRGVVRLDAVYLEASSPVGFWLSRRKLEMQIEFRVHPNLRKERAAAALFLNRGLIGIHTQRQLGKGREFEKLRDYLPGDTFEDIHWKTTAKRGRPVTKTFQVERTQELYVALDASRLSGREVGKALSAEMDVGTAPREWVGKRSLLERAVTAGLLLGMAAEQQGDRMGLIAFDDRLRRFVGPGSGPAHFQVCRDAMIGLSPRRVSPDFEELTSFVRTRIRRRSLLVILTSLDDPVLSEQFLSNVQLLGRRHLVLVQMILPSGERPLFEGREVEDVGEIYQALASHERWAGLRETERALAAKGVSFQWVESEQAGVALITRYMNIKRRQLL